MSLQVRRVVTGHDRNGRAVVTIDEVAQNIVKKRPGYAGCVVWATESFPADSLDIALELTGAEPLAIGANKLEAFG